MDPSALRRVYMNGEYPKEMWYFTGSFIFVVALCQWTAWGLERALVSPNATSVAAPDQEKVLDKPLLASRTPTRRALSAIVNCFRIIAFRSTISLGKYFSINLAEVAITAMYIVALFVWSFVNCEYSAAMLTLC
jgi:ferric-chelate reductase